MHQLENIKGIIFDYGGTLDTGGRHWAWIIRDGYRNAGIHLDDDIFRQAYVHGERWLASHPVISPSDTFDILLEKKINAQFDYLVEHHAIDMLPTQRLAAQHTITAYCDNVARHHTQRSAAVLASLLLRFSFASPSLPLRSSSASPSLPLRVPSASPSLPLRSRSVSAPLSLRFRSALVSNFYGNLTAVLTSYQLLPYFTTVVESALVNVRKPDEAIFRIALERLALPPHQVLVVGDSRNNDILPAQRLGCPTAWLRGQGWNDTPSTPDPPATVIIDDLQQLCTLLAPAQ